MVSSIRSRIYVTAHVCLDYDNGEGKGHHRHYRGREEPYDYLDIWRTIADFKKDLIDMRGSDWDEDQKNNH